MGSQTSAHQAKMEPPQHTSVPRRITSQRVAYFSEKTVSQNIANHSRPVTMLSHRNSDVTCGPTSP